MDNRDNGTGGPTAGTSDTLDLRFGIISKVSPGDFCYAFLLSVTTGI